MGQEGPFVRAVLHEGGRGGMSVQGFDGCHVQGIIGMRCRSWGVLAQAVRFERGFRAWGFRCLPDSACAGLTTSHMGTGIYVSINLPQHQLKNPWQLCLSSASMVKQGLVFWGLQVLEFCCVAWKKLKIPTALPKLVCAGYQVG